MELLISQHTAVQPKDPPAPAEGAGAETAVGLGIAGFWVAGLLVLFALLAIVPRLMAKGRKVGQAT